MWRVVRGEAWHAIILSASMRSNLAAFLAFVESNIDAHATVGVLSHQHATRVCGLSLRSFPTPAIAR